MIDEDVLRALLADAAESAPAPGRAPDALLDAITDGAVPARKPVRRGRVLVGVAAALLLLLVGGAVLVDDAPSDRLTFQSGAPEPTMLPTTTTFPAGIAGGQAVGDVGASATAAGSGGGSGAASGATSGGSSAGAAAPSPAAPPALPTIPDTARVIRTGSLELEVDARGFERAVERITSIAVGLGGYVSESTTTEFDDEPHGTITLRVPAGSFDQLVLEVRKLGDVKAVTSKGTDVTSQFTDLLARLSALTATRDRLFEVLRGARNVGDIIAVQDRITGVQTEIEQLQGQQRLLEDQTSFGTLSVVLGEPGADITEAPEPDDGLGAAWREARRRFGNSLEGLVSWSGSAAVVLLVLAVLAVLGRLAWVRWRRLLV
ncbi:MAG TPA: DUF4349 domain-containing protein [Acidimicrobiales bacterium]|nr:DUF4349 domain-containing protein [Acidimicrobiales bacterium]